MAGFDILVLNGPNLGYVGKRQPEIYGSKGMDQVPALVSELLAEKAQDVRLSFFQTNSEGGLIDRLEQAWNQSVHGIVFNAGAYTHTSLALADCLAWITIPCVEVHLSNIWARTDEPLRQRSYIGSHCIGVVAGFGLLSYALAVQALWKHLSEKKTI